MKQNKLSIIEKNYQQIPKEIRVFLDSFFEIHSIPFMDTNTIRYNTKKQNQQQQFLNQSFSQDGTIATSASTPYINQREEDNSLEQQQNIYEYNYDNQQKQSIQYQQKYRDNYQNKKEYVQQLDKNRQKLSIQSTDDDDIDIEGIIEKDKQLTQQLQQQNQKQFQNNKNQIKINIMQQQSTTNKVQNNIRNTSKITFISDDSDDIDIDQIINENKQQEQLKQQSLDEEDDIDIDLILEQNTQAQQ